MLHSCSCVWDADRIVRNLNNELCGNINNNSHTKKTLILSPENNLFLKMNDVLDEY